MTKKDSKGRVLKEGERERSDGRYEYRFQDLDGKTKSVYATTLKKLREKENDVKVKLSQKVQAVSTITLEKQLIMYIQTKIVSDSTKEFHRKELIRLSQYRIMKMKIVDIKEIHVRELIKQMNEKYSDNTIKGTLKDLKACMNIALRDRIITFNPFDFNYSQMLKGDKQNKKALTDEQFNRLISLLKDHGKTYNWSIPMIIFLRETALRISEFSALTVNDVDLEHKTLNVNKQVMKVSTELGFKVYPLKTNSSNAVIPLTDTAVNAVKEMIDRCDKTLSLDGYDGFFVLGKYKKNFIRQNDFDRMFKRIENLYNKTYPDDQIKFTPHILRHTSATRMMVNGIPPALVQRMLRHSTSRMTMDIYTHIETSDLTEQIRAVL